MATTPARSELGKAAGPDQPGDAPGRRGKMPCRAARRKENALPVH